LKPVVSEKIENKGNKEENMTLTNLIQIKNFALMQRGLEVTVGHMAELHKGCVRVSK